MNNPDRLREVFDKYSIGTTTKLSKIMAFAQFCAAVSELRRDSMKIKVIRKDDLAGFGAYLRPHNFEHKPEDLREIWLNVDACFSAQIDADDSAKRVMIETLMHEFGHALEDYFKTELGEEGIEDIIQQWKGSASRIGISYGNQPAPISTGKSKEEILFQHWKKWMEQTHPSAEEWTKEDFDETSWFFFYDAMEAYAAQPKWISVEDPPKIDCRVFAITNEGRLVLIDYMDSHWDDYSMPNYDYGERITHWRPLPSPPDLTRLREKEGETETK